MLNKNGTPILIGDGNFVLPVIPDEESMYVFQKFEERFIVHEGKCHASEIEKSVLAFAAMKCYRTPNPYRVISAVLKTYASVLSENWNIEGYSIRPEWTAEVTREMAAYAIPHIDRDDPEPFKTFMMMFHQFGVRERQLNLPFSFYLDPTPEEIKTLKGRFDFMFGGQNHVVQ